MSGKGQGARGKGQGAGGEQAPSSVQPPSSVDLPLVLTAAALVLSVLGGGMLYDRVDPKPGYTSLFDLVGVPLASILGSVGLALAAWKGRPSASGRSVLPILFTAFLAWCAVSTLFAANRFAAASMLAVAAGAFALGAVVRTLSCSRGAAVTLAVTLGAAGSFIGARGVGEYLSKWLVEQNVRWRVFGGFTNPDFLAGYLLITLPVTASLLFLADRPLRRALAGVGLLMQVFCFLRTDSRLGLGALLCEAVLFILLLRASGASLGVERRIAMRVGTVLGVLVLLAAVPLLKRLGSSGAELYSARFRLLTWQGTVRMASVNPLVGTGLGTFETAYPPYQVVGYTQHAHNGFLQLAGETGAPGVLLLIAGLAGATAFGIAVVRRRTGGDAPAVPDIVVAGCVSAIVGSVVHNLFDSDFYLPATAFTLAGAVGLVLARIPRQPEEASAASPLAMPLRVGAVLLALGLVWTEGRTAAARIAANGAAGAYDEIRARIVEGNTDQAVMRGLIDTAIDGYRSAASLQPGDFEYALKLANLHEATGQKDEAERLYRDTAASARLGKAYYRYGRFLSVTGHPAEAYEMFRKAREREPNNLSNLLNLADAAKATGKADEAEAIYRRMIALYRSDFGAVRPLPELVDWEFGMAYVNLGELQLARGDKEGAEKSLRDGAGILGEFWRTRHLEIAVIRINEETRKKTSERYQWALERLAALYEEAGRKPEADDARQKLAELERDREADKTRKP